RQRGRGRERRQRRERQEGRRDRGGKRRQRRARIGGCGRGRGRRRRELGRRQRRGGGPGGAGGRPAVQDGEAPGQHVPRHGHVRNERQVGPHAGQVAHQADALARVVQHHLVGVGEHHRQVQRPQNCLSRQVELVDEVLVERGERGRGRRRGAAGVG